MMTSGANLMRDDDVGGDATVIVIMGASGNLTRTKLAPALFSLYRKGRLPKHTHVVGVARDVMSDQEFRDGLRGSIPDADGPQWDEFATQLAYATADVTSADALKTLYERLDEFDPDENGRLNCLYYLALAPGLYEPVVTALSEAGMADERNGWRRIVIEKPFGSDLITAQNLNRHVHSVFREEQIYRIDHYLGKETVQNLMVFRFANSIFEPIWNRNYIDQVQITVAEDVLVGERGEYYDRSGVPEGHVPEPPAATAGADHHGSALCLRGRRFAERKGEGAERGAPDVAAGRPRERGDRPV